MIVRYTRQAAADLTEVHAFIASDRPRAADEVSRRIVAAINHLAAFPNRGRTGRIDGTRELVVPRTSFIAVYRISEPCVDIIAVMHAARRWPDAFRAPPAR